MIYTIEELTGEHYSLDFKLKEQIKEKPEEKVLIKSNTNQVSQLAIQMANLNPRYTFDTFVVGKKQQPGSRRFPSGRRIPGRNL